MLQALATEMELRAPEWQQKKFTTLYFGGGTPTVLTIDEINYLIKKAYQNFHFADTIELTLEGNPDDLTTNYLIDLKNNTPVNRLSIGIQSFDDKILTLMNRRHNSYEAKRCLESVATTGFINLNADLIYGFPGQTIELLKTDLSEIEKFDVPHISAYHLSIEPKTVFDYYQRKGRLKPAAEELSSEHYEILTNWMELNEYEHYEISNFARNHHYSKHNLAYWKGDDYIGIGPSAHSRLGHKRHYNIARNNAYINAVTAHTNQYFESEVLDKTALINEYIITSLRTKWGMQKAFVKRHFSIKVLERLQAKSEVFAKNGDMWIDDQAIGLTRKGRFISDYIFRELFEE